MAEIAEMIDNVSKEKNISNWTRYLQILLPQ